MITDLAHTAGVSADRPGENDERWAVGVVDVQNDFCEGGSLAVGGGAAVAGRIRRWLDADHDRWVATELDERDTNGERHPVRPSR